MLSNTLCGTMVLCCLGLDYIVLYLLVIEILMPVLKRIGCRHMLLFFLLTSSLQQNFVSTLSLPLLFTSLTCILLLLSSCVLLCSEMGDRIALQYGGSEAHKKVLLSCPRFCYQQQSVATRSFYFYFSSLISTSFSPSPFISLGIFWSHRSSNHILFQTRGTLDID